MSEQRRWTCGWAIWASVSAWSLGACWAPDIGAADPPTAAPAPTPASMPAPRNPVRLVLPREVPAVVGVEVNIYFDNLVLARAGRYEFDVICNQGRQQAERWTWTPTAADVGVHEWSIEVRGDDEQAAARGTTKIRVAAADAARDREWQWLAVGDSLTHASEYPRHALGLSRVEGGPRLSLVGSFGPDEPLGEIRHEGFGGWTAHRFVTHYTPHARKGDYRQRGSPFLYAVGDAPPQLDFARYCHDVNGGKTPDFVTIFLGPNDVFAATEETQEKTIDGMLEHLERLVVMFRSASPAPRVGVLLPVPPAASQDAFGANYGSGQTRWQYRRNQHRLVEKLLDRYGRDGASDSGVDLVPTHLALDCVHNYPTASGPANARAAAAIERQDNGVHPSASGYRQIGDAVYAWMLNTVR
ncbi:MAG: SGNH/GDSL hydrolase family protein [Pirellulales bacterium]